MQNGRCYKDEKKLESNKLEIIFPIYLPIFSNLYYWRWVFYYLHFMIYIRSKNEKNDHNDGKV